MKRAFASINKNTLSVYLLMKRTACLLFLFLLTSASSLDARNLSNLSIYDYLKADSHFNTYIRLIDDLNYTELLTTTGSMTLFAANDSAFTQFFKNNPWNVSTYEQLTVAQKNYLLKFSMIRNAYTLSNILNYDNYDRLLMHGQAMRRTTALDVIDSIPYLSGNQLPSSKYWDSRRTKGIYALCDYTAIPIVFFSQDFINNHSLTDKDLKMIAGIDFRSYNDVHVFNDKVMQRDIVCNNGYINILQSVLIPHKNMAQFISENKTGDASQTTTIFSRLLDRFCAPYYDASNTLLYNQLHPEFADSIFVKHYFSANGGVNYLPSGFPCLNLLSYDPGWNSYYTSSSRALEADMAAMFVPSDEAMTSFFNSGVGTILKDKFGSWDNVPDEIISTFILRCMRTSLTNSVPSKFSQMVDEQNNRLPVDESDIVKTYTGVNGVVYVTNKVYPPVDYTKMCNPVLMSDNSKIMNWAINISQSSVDGTRYAFYKLYLNSSAANYSLFIPTDEYFDHYIDPIAYGQDKQGVLKFKYNSKTVSVNALIYTYNKTTGVVGSTPIDSIYSVSFIQNRLWDLLDSHIVTGSVETGDQYFVTKGNDFIKVAGTGTALTVQGGGDIVNNTHAQVTNVFNQANGKTYFINKPISPSLKSVYKILSETPEFNMFFKLLTCVPDTYVNQIFVQQGIDYSIKFFNTFRYTVYVPTNAAIQAAINNGTITPWDQIYAMPVSQKEIATNKMIQFLRYHFQDNAVFFGQKVNGQYQSATIKTDDLPTHWGTSKKKFFKIGVIGAPNSMKLTMDSKAGNAVGTANVLTSDPVTGASLYNIIAKDYLFDKLTSQYKDIDGTGSVTGYSFYDSGITTSSSAVIHEIDNVLTFE